MTGWTLRGRACLALVLTLAAPSCGGCRVEPRSAKDRRLVLIGLDAADERLITQGIEAGRLPRDVLADPMDRLLVATARETEATFLTADARILRYGGRTRTLHTADAGR